MNPILGYQLRPILPVLAFGFLYLIFFQLYSFRHLRHSGTSVFAEFDVFLGAICILLSILFIETERHDQQLEYIWSLPVCPASLFYTKLALYFGVILILIVVHWAFEIFNLFWFVMPSDMVKPTWAKYPLRWHALRLHPIIIGLLCFPLSICFGLSAAGKQLNKLTLWLVIGLFSLTLPWLFLVAVLQELLLGLPFAAQSMATDEFLIMPKSWASDGFVEQFSNSYQQQKVSALFWQGYFGVSVVGCLLALKLARRNYINREVISTEQQQE